jgi:hypothetical protein
MADAQQNAVKDVDMAHTDAAKCKKRPGRPRKKTITAPFEVKGVVDQPTAPENVVEVVYENPRIFKKLFTLYKSYVVDDLIIDFAAETISMITKSHTGKTISFATFNCKLLNHYYCKAAKRICVRRECLSDIFKSLDKVHCKITFLLKEEFQKSILYIIIKDCEMDNEQNYEVELIEKFDNTIPNSIDDENYPLKFELPSKNFKKIIADISNLSNMLTVQKRGEEPLEFTYEQAKKINMTLVFKNHDKIKLRSAVDPGDILSASVMIPYIKPFSNSNIGDNVLISVDRYGPMSFMTELDRKKIDNSDGTVTEGYVCVVKLFADITRYGAVQ